MFTTLEREETLAGRVTRQVEQLLVDCHLQPGDRLPAERDLAAQFGVSRTVIREAVRSLAAKGMVEVRQGSGTTVRTPTVHSLTQPMTMLLKAGQADLDHGKVIEVRRLLEVEIAGLAAERRTAADLAALEQILADTDGNRENREHFVSWDIAFHATLAAATHNELFPLLLNSVVATMRQVREIGFDVPGTPDRALRHHRAIFEQVRLGQARNARRAMLAHLTEGEQTLTRALRLRAARPAKGKAR